MSAARRPQRDRAAVLRPLPAVLRQREPRVSRPQPVLGPQLPAHVLLLLVAHEPGGAGGHLRHDVPHLPALRRGLHPPLPLPHSLSESLLSTEGCQLGIN